jgi:WD40 repeat protein
MNEIVACCISKDSNRIITADNGPESFIIVWNTSKGVPIRRFIQPHPEGTHAVDISYSGSYLATLSKPSKEDSSQTVTIWDLQSNSEAPMFTATAEIDDVHVL